MTAGIWLGHNVYRMMKRALLQAEILEKLGAPLASAAADVAARENGGENGGAVDTQDEARRTAALLGKAVQLGTMLSAGINLKGADESAEAVRAMLTALSGRFVADYYRRTARMPEEGDLRKIAASLEATLAFSDNFIASDEAAGRISQMTPGTVYHDENQLLAQFVGSFAPVVNAVAVFPFGRAENVLIQEIAGHLTEKAENLAKALFPDDGGAPPESGMARLVFLQGLVPIYVACHHEGIEQLKKQSAPADPSADQMARVWEMFGARTAMLETLARYIAPSEERGAQHVPESAPAQPSEAPSPPPAFTAPPEAPQQQSMNVPPVEQPAQESAPGGEQEQTERTANETEQGDGDGSNPNPMSFFGTGKKSGDGDEQE